MRHSDGWMMPRLVFVSVALDVVCRNCTVEVVAIGICESRYQGVRAGHGARARVPSSSMRRNSVQLRGRIACVLRLLCGTEIAADVNYRHRCFGVGSIAVPMRDPRRGAADPVEHRMQLG